MRQINELIWHCSATPEGRHVTVKTIRKWHTDKGWSDIGYHKVVYLDGSVHDGRPMGKIGAHVKGHNTGTIGYCYIGGVAKDAKTAKDTRTPAQKSAMARLTAEAIKNLGVTKVTGHNEYANKACPSFNVQTDRTIQNAIKGKPIITAPTPEKRKAPKGLIPILLAIGAAVAAFLKAKGFW
jgi:N-acetylmuramoyl-L-alanine amidase